VFFTCTACNGFTEWDFGRITPVATGFEMTGYKFFFYLHPKTTVDNAMRMINNYIETGDIGF
jgi:hypothetical protein